MSIAPLPTPVPPKSRRPLWLVGGFALLLALTPVAFYFVSAWLSQRKLDALYAELDADDPNWRYANLAAGLPEPPPDEQNAAVQLLRVRDRLAKTAFPVGGRNAPLLPRLRNARLPAEDAKTRRELLAKAPQSVLAEARKLKDLPEGSFRFEAVENPFDRTKPPDADIRLLTAMHLLEYDALLRTARRRIRRGSRVVPGAPTYGSCDR